MTAQNYLTAETAAKTIAAWQTQMRSPRRPTITLDASACALLVVDVNRYFAHPESHRFLPASTYAVQQIQQLIASWRHIGRPVLYTRHGHLPGSSGAMKRFFREIIMTDSPDADLLAAITPARTEIIHKSSYDAFHNTDLQLRLETAGIKQLVICGLLTDMCCETTARSAFCRDYDVFVAMDATASVTEERHLNALKSMANCCAMVQPTQELIEQCSM